MSHYADAGRCPGCAAPIIPGTASCPSCLLPLHGPLAAELYVTLQRADRLVEALRATVQRPVRDLVPAGNGARPLAGQVEHGPPTPATAPRAMSGASVPQVLLGLGALCLLVAALVFLAVTWSVMGVGGRTATLVGLTVASSVVTAVVARRGLRGATEALGLVTLGLVGLDVAGADHAGWFGHLTSSGLLVVLGAVLLVAATTACLAVRTTPARSFTAGEVTTGLGWGFVVAGLDLDRSTPSAGAALLAVLLAGGGTAVARRLRLRTSTAAVATVTGFAWLFLVAVGLERLGADLTIAHLWGDLAAWPLVVAALLLLTVALMLRTVPPARGAGLSIGTAMLAFVGIAPALDNGTTPATLAVLTTLVASLAVLWFLPLEWSVAAVLTVVAGSGVALVEAALLGNQALERLDAALSADGSFGDRLPAPEVLDGLQPWLLLPDAALLVAAVLVGARLLGLPKPGRAPVALAGLAAAAATAVLYPVPVWTVVVGLLAAGVALLVLDDLVAASVALLAGVGVATYADGLTAAALAVVLAAAVVVHLRDRRELVTRVAAAVAVTTLAASVWVWGDLLDRPGEWTAALGLVVVAVLPLARQDLGLEVGAAVGGVGLTLAGLAAAPVELTATWAAVYLTLAGAAVCTQAVLRDDRRRLGWAGGLLLAAASWVRLADIGVHQPEPYTLPAAVALLVLGIVQLRRRPDENTVRLLGPGLGLALTPSLLWVLDDPTTWRALLLGLACLGLVLAGLRLRWTAPLLFGSVVGAAVVLRCAAPYVGDAVPRWATIGAAGVLLVALGITWEARVREARLLLGYVRALR